MQVSIELAFNVTRNIVSFKLLYVVDEISIFSMICSSFNTKR